MVPWRRPHFASRQLLSGSDCRHQDNPNECDPILTASELESWLNQRLAYGIGSVVELSQPVGGVLVAAKRGVAPETAALDLLIREGGEVEVVHYGMDEADVRYTLRHHASMVCTDALAVTPEHPLGGGLSHPRFYGTFPRVLGHYARDEGLFSMEEAVHRMAGKTADRLALRAKGKIEAGKDADIVVFDEDQIIDLATFEDPHRYPAGIEHVMVGGSFDVRGGEPTDQLPGKVMRRPEGIPIGPVS